MKRLVHFIPPTIIAACLYCSSSHVAFAEAPVVDESENFALFDEQLAATDERPDAFMPNRQTDQDATTSIASRDFFAEENTTDAIARDNTTNEDQDPNALFGRVQALQQELNELRGQFEVQAHILETLKAQQIEFYKDLDSRLNAQLTHEPRDATEPQEKHAKSEDTSTHNVTLSSAPRGNPANEQVSYLAAYDLVKNREFDKAVMALKSFINNYPQGGYTANAHYWLGEVYLTKEEYNSAIQQFEAVLNRFPHSSKSSAASLKLGYAFAESGDTDSARKHLKSVVRDYPDTHAAKLATRKLDTLKS